MALNPTALANSIRSDMGFPLPVSAQLTGWAKGVIEEITSAASATFGGIPGPHPISGMSATSMAGKVAGYAGYPGVSPELQDFCQGIINHMTGAGVVTYTSPTGTPPNYFLGGTISGMSGSGMATAVKTEVGFPSVSGPLLQFCTAVVTHIQANAVVVSGVIS